MISFEYIDNEQQLENCCLKLKNSPVLSIDTEFVRERTFYPAPGLIQVSDGNIIILIDPLACVNLQAFFVLLESDKTQIVMHSCSEDLELFYHMGCGKIHNLFDTQIAASWLGMGQSLSLQKLVEYYENIIIEKQLSRTNWLKRPLSDAQLQYAATDVLYLNSIYQQQKQLLLELEYLNNMLEDCDLQCEIQTRETQDDLAYMKVKRAVVATGDALKRLQKITVWREQRARQDDKPRQHIVKDLQLINISVEFPQTIEQLTDKCSLPDFIVKRYGKQIINEINNSSTKYKEPRPVLSLRSLPNASKTLKDCRDLMITIQKHTGIPREVLPSKRWLEQFLLHHAAYWYPEPDGWKGWRRDLLEQKIQQLINNNNFSKINTESVVTN